MTIVTQAQPAVKPQIVEADGLELAHQWGREDALEGVDRRGSQYFYLGGPAHGAYNEGYDAGQAQRERSQVLATLATAVLLPSDFAAALGDIAARQGKLIYCPVGSIDHDALEAERIGD